MWKNINVDQVGNIEKMVGEFLIWMPELLPYAKMKIKIYENRDGKYTGYTDVRILRVYDKTPEGAVGFGNSVEVALEQTLKNFVEIAMLDYSGKLEDKDIEYSDWSDF